MPCFYTGDELGSIKSASFSRDDKDEWICTTSVILEGSGKTQAVQKLALGAQARAKRQLAAARSDGSLCVFDLDNGNLVEGLEWKETRMKGDQKFVGFSFTESAVYSCTSNGALRRAEISSEDSISNSSLATLPTRLAEFRLSPDATTFAYAGDEVELSVWDGERAFSSNTSENTPLQSSKRKRSEQLLPSEVWRAKNLPNDSLNLRQPVRNTAVTYLDTPKNASHQQFLVGTQFGDVRRYDTRAARRPVSNWKAIGKVGGIVAVEAGFSEYQAFVADRGTNLFALDLRNGQISYGYKGIAGAMTSIAPAPTFLASGASDRFLRLHSTYPPPEEIGDQQNEKGQVLNKSYVKVTPTVVVWDGRSDLPERSTDHEEVQDEDELWDGMEEVESDEEAGRKKARTK